MRRGREFEVFSLSFLDCICCGFGAVILLLVISDYRQPVMLEETRRKLQAQAAALTRELEQMRADSSAAERQLRSGRAALVRDRQELARLAGELSEVQGQYATSRREGSVSNAEEAALVEARARLASRAQAQREEQRARLARAVGGIPVDSDYVILMIDTSSSMTDNHWNQATAVLAEILDLYPHLKGFQVLSDRGRPMFSGTYGRWLTDSAQLRGQVLARMKDWRVPSDSNPVEGIRDAIRAYWSAERHISLYVLGDEFTGDSTQQALDGVREVNKPDALGRPLVRIHAVGFPEASGFSPFTSIKYAALMRLMCEQNGGTFVGL
jgi:hypothetical protein